MSSTIQLRRQEEKKKKEKEKEEKRRWRRKRRGEGKNAKPNKVEERKLYIIQELSNRKQKDTENINKVTS